MNPGVKKKTVPGLLLAMWTRLVWTVCFFCRNKDQRMYSHSCT